MMHNFSTPVKEMRKISIELKGTFPELENRKLGQQAYWQEKVNIRIQDPFPRNREISGNFQKL